MQALYADVPMSISLLGLQGRVMHTTRGLKQGCPLNPTLFSLYIADFEQRVLEAASSGARLDPPVPAGCPLPPLLYTDDMALLATSPDGLQAHLRLLEAYCAERGLTVNLAKTKVMLLASANSEAQALGRVQEAGLAYAGGRLEGTTQYLGVTFHRTHPLGESAPAARVVAARCAMATFEGRCALLGLQAPRLLLILHNQYVDSTLSYAAAV